MFAKEIDEFCSFVLRQVQSPSYHFSKDQLKEILGVLDEIKYHPLLPKEHYQQVDEIMQIVVIAQKLVEFCDWSLPTIHQVIQEETVWCKEHFISFETASVKEIDAYLQLQSVQLLETIVKEREKAISLVTDVKKYCFSYLPSEILKYIIVPIMISRNTLASLNSASDLTEGMNGEWINQMILQSVTDSVLAMNV